MKALTVGGVALAVFVGGAPAMAAPSSQPPMNNFNNAYYTCDDNGAFLMSYDSNKPATATMTTSPSSKTYKLKKAPVAMGVQFTDGTVKFWTDGKTVTVDGTESPFANCKLKTS